MFFPDKVLSALHVCLSSSCRVSDPCTWRRPGPGDTIILERNLKKLAKLRRSYQRANLKRKLHLGIKLNEKKLLNWNVVGSNWIRMRSRCEWGQARCGKVLKRLTGWAGCLASESTTLIHPSIGRQRQWQTQTQRFTGWAGCLASYSISIIFILLRQQSCTYIVFAAVPLNIL